MVDFAMDVHGTLYPDQEVPQSLVDKRAMVVEKFKELQAETDPVLRIFTEPEVTKQIQDPATMLSSTSGRRFSIFIQFRLNLAMLRKMRAYSALSKRQTLKARGGTLANQRRRRDYACHCESSYAKWCQFTGSALCMRRKIIRRMTCSSAVSAVACKVCDKAAKTCSNASRTLREASSLRKAGQLL